VISSKSLSAKQFRAIVRARGYRLRDIAELWGLTPARLSQIAADPERPSHYEYALWGLPKKKLAALVMGRRQEAARALVEASEAEPQRSGAESVAIEPRDVWIVRESPGDHLPEGCEGIVQAVQYRDGEQQVSLHFPATDYAETFSVTYLNDPTCFLVATGRQVASRAGELPPEGVEGFLPQSVWFARRLA